MRSALVVEVQCAKARVYHYILCQSSVLTWENQHINRPTSLRSARSRPRRHGSVTRLENHCDQPRKCDSTAGRSLASSGNPSSVASKEPGSHIIAGTTGGYVVFFFLLLVRNEYCRLKSTPLKRLDTAYTDLTHHLVHVSEG